MDLYADLGVPRCAPAVEITRAYRKKAKTAHPDHGGDSEAFGKIARAKLVLSDPARRAKYDQTGEVDETSDHSAQQVLDLIAKAFEGALQMLVKSGQEPAAFDMLAHMKLDIGAQIGQARANRGQGEGLLRQVEKVTGRFAIKGQPNQIEAIVAGRIADLRRRLALSDAQIALFETAIETLKAYSYRVDRGDKTMPFYALGATPFGQRRW